MSDAGRIKELLRERIAELGQYLFPNGHREGNHWCVGSIDGEPGKSFKICISGPKAGLSGDFAESGKHSANLLDLWMHARNVDFKTALREAAEWLGQPLNRPNAAAQSVPKRSSTSTFRTLDDAIAITERGLTMRATRRDTYYDCSGNEHFVVVRFEDAAKKDFRPFSRNGSGWVVKDPPGKLPLFRLPELIARPGELVLNVEGEKCACELATLGLLVTTSAHGAGSAHKTDWQPLAGRDVVILPDNDAGGRGYAQTVAGILNRLSPPAVVKIVALPGLPKKGDCVEWLDARNAQTPEDITAELLALVEDTQPVESNLAVNSPSDIAARLNSDTPKIELPGDGRLLSKFAADLGETLKEHGIYQRGGLAFIVNQRQDGLEVVTAQMLRTLVEQHLVCFRIKHTSQTELSFERTMSEGDAQGVLCAQQFLARLPRVEKVSTARLPVIRGGGAVELLPTGYDSESLTLTLPQCQYGESMPLTRAKNVIEELLSEFPFADKGRSKAVAVSAMVGLFAVGLLPKGALRPVFIYLANAEGAGKTMLAKCAIAPVHGIVKVDGDLKDKTETAKELLTAVMEARPYILFDNCKKHLDSPYLEAFATAQVWSGRVLGVSKSFNGENNVTVFVTGNGCTVSPDMRRRSLFVELFMENERAEDREFRRILDDAALPSMRSEILGALWALVREWDAAGRPKPNRTHSSFSRWAEIIGGIVEFAGYGCPMETAEIQSATDIDGADMRELVKLLANNGETMKFDEVVAKAREHGLFERLIGTEGELKPAEKSALGKLFKRYDRRIFGGGTRFVVDGKGHTRTFRAINENTE